METSRTFAQLLENARRLRVDCIIGDDYFPRLQLSGRLATRLKVPHITYCHILFGMQTLNPRLLSNDLSPRGLGLNLGTLIPFRVLVRAYTRMLQSANALVANSQFTAQLLNANYGVECRRVIYPPTATFCRRELKALKSSPQHAIVYFGSVREGGKEAASRVSLLCRANHIEHCDLIGSRETSALFASVFGGNSEYHADLSDTALASLYSSSEITILPQGWESFGLVGPESLLSGTPVALFNFQPWMEIAYDKAFIAVVTPTESLEECHESPDDLSRLGSNLQSKLEGHLSASNFMKQITSVCERVLSQNSGNISK